MKLLVLDDDKWIRAGFAAFLKTKYEVVQAANYSEAITAIESQPEINGAIVDVDLSDPQHDGFDFLKKFKEKWPERPVIMQSGFADDATLNKCQQLGASDYFVKPPDLNLLLSKLNSLLH